MKKISTFCLVLLSALASWAYDFKSGDLYYNITSDVAPYTVEVTYEEYFTDNYSGLTTATIPASISYNGITYSVTSIGDQAFKYCSSLTSITIPNSVTSIGVNAFDGCTSLTSITIPNSVTSIGDNAFGGCTSLTSITIPNSVTSIGEGAFGYCTSLTSITIPESVTSIGFEAFEGCTSLTSVTIPNSVTSIGEDAFNGCTSLTSVTLGSGVTSIGRGAFYECTSLASITCKATTPPALGSYVFPSELTTCYIPCGTKSAYEASDWAQYVSEFVEEGCGGIEQITYTTMNDSVVAFNTASDFGADFVKNEYKDGKGVIYFSAPITKIGAAAFSSCGSLTSITLPEGVVSIEEGAFNACTQLASVVLPNTVASIGNNAFNSCYALTSITIPESVKTIGESAFANCVSLTSITLPDALTSLGGSAFMACGLLQSVNLPSGLASVDDQTFLGCGSLRTITIPSNIKNIGWLAFSGCSGLKSITCESKEPAILETNAFYNVSKSIPVYIPCASLENYEKAAGWKEFTRLTEPEPEITELQETACDSYLWNLNGKTYTASTKDSVVLTTAEGCDSIVVLNLTINQSVEAEMTVDTCDTYTWNGQTYTNSGDYTYTTTAQNGCDSTITLHLTIYPSYHVDTIAIACDEFEWYGNTYTASGDYTYTTTTINGCDSIVTLHLTVNKSTIGAPQLDTICYGETFTWNGQDYTATGEYQQTLTNAAGCDSLATLQLLVLPQMITQEEKVAVCPSQLPYSWKGQTLTTTGTYSHRVPFAGTTCDSIEHLLAFEVLPIATSETSEVACDTYTWNGNTYTASGDYTFTTTGANGCDSIATLHLTINHSVKTEETAVACDTYTWNGITYSKSGDYTYTTTAQNGCDSTITLHLTINQSVEAEVAEVACDSYTWNGKTYTTSGDYTFTTTAKNGCDSTTTLHLTINHSVKTEETAEACDSYTWAANGQTYTASGDFTHTLQTIHGCDSTITLHLTINKSVATEQTIEACDSYTWNNITYQRSGDYVQRLTAANGCDSVVTLHLTIHKSVEVVTTETACDSYTWDVNGQTYSVSGTYTDTLQTLHGCDSIVVLRLTINKSVETEETTEACDSYTWNGNTYTTSGDYTYTTTAANGCDSTITLHLTINQSVKKEETAVACDSYTWNGKTYTTSGDYTFITTAKNGCDSTTTLHLTINNSVKTEETVEACDTYTWNGKTYTKSGDYTFTTTAKNGCDSTITLHLTINKSVEVIKRETACDSYYWNNTGKTYDQSGVYYDSLYTLHGCDSVIVLHLTINKSVKAEETVEACDSYTWNGKTYTTSGDYTFTTTAKNGCDSTTTLHLTINNSVKTEETVEACDSYTWNGKTYTTSGDYTFTTTAKNGCDSTITLHLTINKSVEVIERETACDSYYWNNTGKTYNQSGVYYDSLQTIHGCDSVIVLHLTINKSVETEENIVACDSYTWKANGQTYTVSGDYTHTLQTIHGCDSVVTLHLTVNKSVEVEETIEACDSYIWNGKTYTKSGDYIFTTTAKNGCDSTITLHLTINKSVEVIQRETACDSYYWNNTGKTYDQSGVYYDSLQTIHGCDSVIVLHLTINKSVETEETIVACDSYTWNGKTYTTSGDYTFTTTAKNGCDSTTTLHLTINNSVKTEETVEACDSYTWDGKTYTKSGDYIFTTTAKNGCDSTITLHLTINKSIEVVIRETACDSYYWENTGKTYTETGVYYDTLQTAHGCDSVIVLRLTVNHSTTGEEWKTICYGETYKWHGTIYEATGDYTYTLINSVGCDSIATLHLTVMPKMITDNQSVSVCPSELPYIWYGNKLTTKGTYTHREQFANVDCDSVEHVLKFDVLPTSKSTTVVEACDSYTWHGQTYTASGNYTFTTQGANGCDSVATLILTVHKSIVTNLTATACDSYYWENTGKTYDQSGIYYDSLHTVHGCDSVVALHLTVNKSTVGAPREAFICHGETYNWNGVIYDAAGNYQQTLTNAVGCDSIAYLHLTILPAAQTLPTEKHAICYGETYNWHGINCNMEKTYTYVVKNFLGCDSLIYTLDLKVLPPTKYLPAEKAMICWGDTYPWATNSKVYDKTGTYTHVIKNFLGCDSLVYTLELTELPAVVTMPVEKKYICWGDTYTWHGKTYDKTTTDTYVVKNILGCDSIVYTLNLTELPEMKTRNESISICPSELPYAWRGQQLTKSGIYTSYVPFAANTTCDSLEYVLNLVVKEETKSEQSVTACDSYTWNGQKYTQSGRYTFTTTGANACDSTAILYLTINHSTSSEEYVTICYGETYEWNGSVYTEEGIYTMSFTNAAGCDSTAILNLTILPEAQHEYEELTVCPSELPYNWYGQRLTEPGTYTYQEQHTHDDCVKTEFHLTLKVYNFSAPSKVTMPRAICGNVVDVIAATEEIEAYIASIPSYAANATVGWQIKKNGTWATLTNEPVKGGVGEITLRYVIYSECGSLPSEEMVVPVEMPTPENDVDMDGISIQSRYNNRIFLFDLNAFNAKFGWKPEPAQVVWYKVVGTVDTYGEKGDDIKVGVGHSYNMPNGAVIEGAYYVLVERMEVTGDECEAAYRSVVISTVVGAQAPKLVPNAVRPSEMMTIKDLDPNQINEIYVYSTTGEMLATYTAEKVREFMLRASNTTGYYIIDVVNNDGKHTLKYIVK